MKPSAPVTITVFAISQNLLCNFVCFYTKYPAAPPPAALRVGAGSVVTQLLLSII